MNMTFVDFVKMTEMVTKKTNKIKNKDVTSVLMYFYYYYLETYWGEKM